MVVELSWSHTWLSYFLELVLGQFSSKSAIKIWDVVPAFRGKQNKEATCLNVYIIVTHCNSGVGNAQAIVCIATLSYYASLIATSLYYFGASFQTVLPWTVCDLNATLSNTVCLNPGENRTKALEDCIPTDPTKNCTVITSADQYYSQNVMHYTQDISNGIGNPDLIKRS